MPGTPALQGVTVLELGARVGASVAGSLLAQLGATVVFIEPTGIGGYAEPKWLHREQFAAGKLSLAVDVSSEVDRRLLDELAQICDVLLVSSDADAAAHGAPPLQRLPEQAVVCDVTAFGSTGPLSGTPFTDAQVQALTGVMEATGSPDGPPMPIPLPLLEQLCGVYACAAVLAALRTCRGDGRGQSAEVALHDVAFSAMTSFLAPALSGDGREAITRVGNRHTMAAPWNVYRARDGWVLLCAGNDEQWQRICDLIGQREQGSSPRLAKNADRVAHAGEVDELVQGWVGGQDIDECVRQLSALSIPCGPVTPIDGFPREANLQHRRMVFDAIDPSSGRGIKLPGSPLRMSRSPGQALVRLSAPGADRERVQALLRPPRASGSAASSTKRTADAQCSSPLAQPLAGIRVLEIGHYTTAPAAARLLAALGAEVIKVEPPEGEAVRRWPPSRHGQGLFFTFQNADKKSLALDMTSTAGREALMRLIASSDVLIENLRPGALTRKGYGPRQMLALNPRLVYCSISGFGADSLYEGRPAFDAVIQAMSGLMDINHIDGMPLKTGPSLADVMGAAFGLVAVLAALEHRARSGEGQHVDLSMQDVGAWATQTAWNRASDAQPAATVLACRDGHVLAGCAPAQANLLSERFSADTLPRSLLAEALHAAGIQAVPILGIDEVVAQPQTMARELWFEVQDEGTAYPLLASPLRLLGTAAAIPRPAPRLGRDNDTILRELT